MQALINDLYSIVVTFLKLIFSLAVIAGVATIGLLLLKHFMDLIGVECPKWLQWLEYLG